MLRYQANMRWRALAAVILSPAAVGFIVWMHIRGHDHILTKALLTLIGPVGWVVCILLAFLVPVLFVDTAFRLSSGTREAASVLPTGIQFNAFRHPGFIAWNELADASLTRIWVRRRFHYKLNDALTPEAWRARGMLPGSRWLSISVGLLEEDPMVVADWVDDLLDQRQRARESAPPAQRSVRQPAPPPRGFGRKLA